MNCPNFLVDLLANLIIKRSESIPTALIVFSVFSLFGRKSVVKFNFQSAKTAQPHHLLLQRLHCGDFISSNYIIHYNLTKPFCQAVFKGFRFYNPL